jgi:hypothetical protein
VRHERQIGCRYGDRRRGGTRRRRALEHGLHARPKSLERGGAIRTRRRCARRLEP